MGLRRDATGHMLLLLYMSFLGHRVHSLIPYVSHAIACANGVRLRYPFLRLSRLRIGPFNSCIGGSRGGGYLFNSKIR